MEQRKAVRYRAPTLNLRVCVRNPSERPAEAVDAYGRPTGGGAEWGMMVWAARRDARPTEEFEEQATLRKQVVVWTMRRRSGVDPDAEVVHDGQVYESAGPARLVGGVNFGTGAEYMELHTVQRV